MIRREGEGVVQIVNLSELALAPFALKRTHNARGIVRRLEYPPMEGSGPMDLNSIDTGSLDTLFFTHLQPQILRGIVWVHVR
jgi:hypothetical protein